MIKKLLALSLMNPGCLLLLENIDQRLICGDGILGQSLFDDIPEECDDGNNLDGDGCSSSCNVEGLGGDCGNEVIDAGEDCDGVDLSGADCNTATNGALPLGTLNCNADCTFETSQCSSVAVCGDAVAQDPEECDDGGAINGDGCDINCQLEVQNNCDNNNNRTGGEFCDGADLDGRDCADFGFTSGNLLCDNCNFDTAACIP